jgi:hypothetical protein
VLAEVSLHRLCEPRFLHELDQAYLHRLVALARRRLLLRDDARASLQHRDRADVTLVIKQLRHADLFSDNAVDCHNLLISPHHPP